MNNIQFSQWYFSAILRSRPQAFALLRGSPDYPALRGVLRFYPTPFGVLVQSEFHNLPDSGDPCHPSVLGLHIHEGSSCTGNAEDPFANARSHWNPGNCLHPYHAGDLPPVFGNAGNAYGVVLTDRFDIAGIVGKTVILHSSPDDFTTQPSGNSGKKIACGRIRR